VFFFVFFFVRFLFFVVNCSF